MAYGFYEDKTKAPVYTKDEVYSKNETYSKNEVYPKADVYTKDETNAAIDQATIVDNVDDTLNGQSENPVQNKVIKSALDNKASNNDIYRVLILLSEKANAASVDRRISNVEDSVELVKNQTTEATEIAEQASSDAREAIEAIGDISELAVPVMSENIRGGARLGDGLHVDSDALSIGPLVKSATGAEVETDGCALFGVTGEGKTEQVSTTGKNLLDASVSNVTSYNRCAYVEADGALVLTRNTAGSFAYIGFRVPLAAEQTYTLSFSAEATNHYHVRVVCFDASDASIGNALERVEQEQSVFTTLAGTATAIVYFFVGPVGGGGAVDDMAYFSNIQLEAGSSATSFEPYTGGKPSPSPDYPQEVVGVKGRNLIDRSKSTIGIYINDAGEEVADTNSETTDYIPVEPGFYTIKFLAKTAGNLRLHGYSADKQTVTLIGKTSPSAAAGTYGIVTAEVTSDIAWVRVSYYVNSEEVQLNTGSTPMPYVPFGHVGLESRAAFELYKQNMRYDGSGKEMANTQFSIYRAKASAGTRYLVYDNTNAYYLYAFAFDAQGRSLGQLFATTAKGADAAAMTVPAGAAEIRWCLHNTSSAAIIDVTPIPLPSKGQADAIGSYADALSIDSAGRWEWDVQVGRAVFDGTEAWVSAQSGKSVGLVNASIIPLASGSAMGYGLSSHFMPTSTAEASRGTVGFAFTSTGGVIFQDGTSAMALADWATWLTANNVTLAYILGTPTTEHGYLDLPALPRGSVVSIPELDEIGVEWWVEGAEAVVEHAGNMFRRDQSENEEIEDAVADLAARVAVLESN